MWIAIIAVFVLAALGGGVLVFALLVARGRASPASQEGPQEMAVALGFQRMNEPQRGQPTWWAGQVDGQRCAITTITGVSANASAGRASALLRVAVGIARQEPLGARVRRAPHLGLASSPDPRDAFSTLEHPERLPAETIAALGLFAARRGPFRLQDLASLDWTYHLDERILDGAPSVFVHDSALVQDVAALRGLLGEMMAIARGLES